MAVILSYKHILASLLILYGTQRGKVCQIIRTDDNTAGVYSYLAHCTFKLRCVLQHLAYATAAVKVFSLLDLRYERYAVLHSNLRRLACLRVFRELVWYVAHQFVHLRQRNVLNTAHILDTRLGSHGTIGDNVRHTLLAIFLSNPVKHKRTPVIIKVHIYIRQRYTVRVKETLKQQVISQRVYICDAKTVRHHTAGGTATPRPHTHAKLLTCCANIVHYNKEVARETHCLHGMKLKHNVLLDLITQHLTITFMSTSPCQFGQIVSL